MLKYEAAVVAGKYTKNGEEKTRWMKVGAVIERSNGKMAMKLDAIPLPNEKGEVWIEFFEPRSKDDALHKSTQAQSLSDMQEDIPFN